MRAWQLHGTAGPSSYRLDEVEVPVPGPGEVRVRPRIVALNHLDLWMSMGMPAPPRLPHVTGADAAGVVDAVGDLVTGLEAGDEVIVNPSRSCGACRQCLSGDIIYCRSFGVMGEHHPGTFAEAVVLPARNAVAKPPGLDWATAGSFGLATGTAYRMLRRARVTTGDTVLIVGVGGGVSSAALVLAVAMGARVYVTSRSREKIAWAVEHGATAGFPSDSEFARELKSAGGPVDVVVENVGAATWNQSVRSLRPGGRLVLCGATSGRTVELSLPPVWFRQLEIIGSTMFTHGEFDDAVGLVASGAVRPPVDRVLAFEELPEALDLVEQGAQLGKIALAVTDVSGGGR